HGLPKQDIMTFELLIGTDGKKMSKSMPNCILIDDAPFDMYQKLININDDLLLHYFELATDMTLDEVAEVKKRLEGGEHPNVLKIELAQRIITMYHGKPFDPSDASSIEEIHIDASERTLSDLLKEIGFCATSGDVRNTLAGNSVRVNDEMVSDPKMIIKLSAKQGTLVQMGKKKIRNVFGK
ncbi:MAG: hypothetical protein Q8K26_04315, partial [Candidatus Gracilibacteria bacterium]|nr:hypothetical protein [Candidatus Gracilibacteria bacterium]